MTTPRTQKRTTTTPRTQKWRTYDNRNSGPGLRQAKQCGRIKPFNGIPTLKVTVLIRRV
jgi:hypothetical protein